MVPGAQRLSQDPHTALRNDLHGIVVRRLFWKLAIPRYELLAAVANTGAGNDHGVFLSVLVNFSFRSAAVQGGSYTTDYEDYIF